MMKQSSYGSCTPFEKQDFTKDRAKVLRLFLTQTVPFPKFSIHHIVLTLCGYSLVVECDLPKVEIGVRFPVSAQISIEKQASDASERRVPRAVQDLL